MVIFSCGNFIYDNELIRISLTRDNITKNLAGKYGVKNISTTLLVSKKGFVNKRRDNLALTIGTIGNFFIDRKKNEGKQLSSW